MDIGLNQALALRKRMLINAYRRGDVKGAFWAINTPLSAWAPPGPPSIPVAPGKTADLSDIRTRLERFKEQEQCELIIWGYAVSDAAIRSHSAQIVKHHADPVLPYPGHPLN